MKKALLSTLLIVGVGFLISCKKKDKKEEDTPNVPNVEVTTTVVNSNGFSYKKFYQSTVSATTRRGIIILAVGDGGGINDGTLNEQCDALARKGFVAITTTYRGMPNVFADWYVTFKEDMEQIITNETAVFNITRDKVVLGGLSRGGNLLFSAVLPGQPVAPFEGIKGVILECAGGDNWKGTAILLPVLYMSNATDAAVGADGNAFQTGLQSNNNPNVSSKSHCHIVSGEGHCTNATEYKTFIVQHIDSWF